MQQGTLAVAELVGVIDGAGTAFGWTRSYRNVVGTAIGAAYRAAGLDEDIDRIAVDPGSAESIALVTNASSGAAVWRASSADLKPAAARSFPLFASPAVWV